MDLCGRAVDFGRSLTVDLHRAPQRTALLQHLGVYAYRPATLARWTRLPADRREMAEGLEQLRPLAHGMTIGVAALAAPVPHGIDTERDLRLAEALL